VEVSVPLLPWVCRVNGRSKSTILRGNRKAPFRRLARVRGLASVRDVYLADLFPARESAHGGVGRLRLCSLVFLPIALGPDPASLRRLLARPRELFGSTPRRRSPGFLLLCAPHDRAPSWYRSCSRASGHCPSRGSIAGSPAGGDGLAHPRRSLAFSRRARGARSRCGRAQRTLGDRAAAVTTAGLGVALAIVAGVSITVNTTLCRRLNDAGVDPAAADVGAFVARVVAAARWPASSRRSWFPARSRSWWGASLGLIVLANYVNQVRNLAGVALTVRVRPRRRAGADVPAPARGRRLSSSPYSLGAAVLYGVFANLWRRSPGVGDQPGAVRLIHPVSGKLRFASAGLRRREARAGLAHRVDQRARSASVVA